MTFVDAAGQQIEVVQPVHWSRSEARSFRETDADLMVAFRTVNPEREVQSCQDERCGCLAIVLAEVETGFGLDSVVVAADRTALIAVDRKIPMVEAGPLGEPQVLHLHRKGPMSARDCRTESSALLGLPNPRRGLDCDEPSLRLVRGRCSANMIQLSWSCWSREPVPSAGYMLIVASAIEAVPTGCE